MDLSKYPKNFRTREEAKALLGSVTSLRVKGLIKETKKMQKDKEEKEKKEKVDRKK